MYRNILVLVVVCLFFSVGVQAQNGRTGYFVTKLGRDTIAIEKFSADAHGLRGTAVARSPRTTLREYSASFDDAGNLQNFHVISRVYGGATVSEREFVYSDDSIHITSKQDTVTTRSAIGSGSRSFPLFVDLFGPWQMILKRALDMHENQFGVTARRIMHYTINGTAPGMIDLVNTDGDFGPIHAVIGKDGDLEKFDMTATTDKFIAERVEFVDVKAMAKAFSERERAGSSLGILSPRDSVRTEVQGARLAIDYSRPAVRGRTIFGNVVPWDSVWRTGANAATQFTTDKELQFGSVTVPPGTYTLFTIPGTDRWQIIINRQHGQWGTEYDQAKDLARIPLDVKHLDDLVERFIIGITPEGTGGVLHFEWEHTEASVRFTVR